MPMRYAMKHPRASIVSFLVGALFLAPMALRSGEAVLAEIHQAYDERHPVVTMAGTLVSEDVDSVVIHIAGEKSADRAAACTYVRLLAYTRSGDGQLRDAYIKRLDMQEDGHTKPAGTFDIGQWRIWPRGGAVGVLVFAVHECSGRKVRTKIAEVAL